MTEQFNYYKRREEDIEFDILAELAKLHVEQKLPIKSQALARRLAHPYLRGLETTVANRLGSLSKKGYVQGSPIEGELTSRSKYPSKSWDITRAGIDWVNSQVSG